MSPEQTGRPRTRAQHALALAAMAGAVLLSACSAPSPPAGTPEAGGTTGYDLPPTEGVFDYQLGGADDRVDRGSGPEPLDVAVRDATAEPPPDAYGICYVNGFQTQPDEAAIWAEHRDLLLDDPSGALAVDPEWPDEQILDPSTAAQREGIVALLGPVISGCARDGFDAVEIDNLDTWTRFASIDEEGAQALAAEYVDLAHEAGLAVAQKNAAEIARLAHEELGFDFAVAEECGAWDECDAYAEAYGPHVLQIEYPDALAEAGLSFADVCAAGDRAPLTILRDRALVARGEEGHVYRACGERTG